MSTSLEKSILCNVMKKRVFCTAPAMICIIISFKNNILLTVFQLASICVLLSTFLDP